MFDELSKISSSSLGSWFWIPCWHCLLGVVTWQIPSSSLQLSAMALCWFSFSLSLSCDRCDSSLFLLKACSCQRQSFFKMGYTLLFLLSPFMKWSHLGIEILQFELVLWLLSSCVPEKTKEILFSSQTVLQVANRTVLGEEGKRE